MSQASIKSVVPRDRKVEQCNVGFPTQPRAENTTRNKVIWQKDILPGGRVDWVIVGFDAPVSIEKKVGAQVGAREISVERGENGSGGLIAATVPIELGSIIEKGVLDLSTGKEGSREMCGNTVGRLGAITMKVITKEVTILENRKTSEHGQGAIMSREPRYNYEASEDGMSVSTSGGAPMPLKRRSDGNAPPTPVGLFNPSQWPRYTTSVMTRNLPNVSGREGRDLERESRDLNLRMQINQESRAVLSNSSPKRRLINPRSRNSSPMSTAARRPHPAEIIKSFHSSVSTNSSSLRKVYSPLFNIQNSKARLNTSILPRTNQSTTRRPKTTISVASRMITHALDVRAVPRAQKAEVKSK